MAKKTKGDYNVSYTQKIIERMLGGSEAAMKKFHDDYCNVRYSGHHGSSMREPSKQEMKVVKMWQSGLTFSEIKQKTGFEHAQVDAILKRVGKFMLLLKGE